MGVSLLALFSAVAGTACSSSSDAGAASYCDTWTGRERACSILGQGETNCLNYNDGAEPCETQCIANASCAELTAATCGGDTTSSAYEICLAKCVGLQPVTCDNGRILDGYVRCNGNAECADGSDEQGCAHTGYKCRTVNQFVDYPKFCDKHQDCLDGSDEGAGCASVLCKVDGVTTEVPFYDYCNGHSDCDGDVDEPVTCAPKVCPDQ